MFDKLKQLHQMKQQMDATKERLNGISVKGESGGVTVVANGNRRVIEVILPEASSSGTVELAQHVLAATNSALTAAEGVFESEMRSVAGGLMGGLGIS